MGCLLYILFFAGVIAFFWYVPWVGFVMDYWYLALAFLGLLYLAAWTSKRWEEFKRV